MHEEALARDLRRKLEELARSAAPRRVRGVRLWVGALSHLTDATLRELWPRITDGTGAEGARLTVDPSRDLTDPRAQGVVLVSVDLDELEEHLPTDRSEA
ncbi:MAG: hydrogenase/urease maturation nickel metallochaperone HypA [Thermoplasmata archaeon]